MFLSLIFLCGLYCLAQAHESRTCLTAEERLFHDLIDAYEPHLLHTRPVSQHNDTLELALGMNLININSFSEDSGVGEFLCWDKYQWTDSRLTWNPDHYDGITGIRIPANLIWRPDVVTYNSLWSRDSDHVGDVMAHVSNTGNVLYIPMHIRKAKCKEHSKTLADDEFECNFKVGSWTYSADLMSLSFYGGVEKMDTTDFMGDKSHILQNKAVLTSKKYDCCPELYQDITFTIVLSDDGV